MIQESVESSATILDAGTQLIYASSAVHSPAQRLGLRAVLEDFPLASMQPGHVYCMNDPFRGGIHSNDLIVLKPVFHGGRPVFFSSTLVHVADLGGAASGGLPANVTENTFGEGIAATPRDALLGWRGERIRFAFWRTTPVCGRTCWAMFSRLSAV